jgi:tetratricopeptide (TPR) repeat protein
MQRHRRLMTAAFVAAAGLVLAAQDPPPADAQLKAADAAWTDRHYKEALAGYRQARASTDPVIRVRGGVGAVKVMLRLGQFSLAKTEAASVLARDPNNPSALAIHGDALWAAGLFFEAEDAYAGALKANPRSAPALHGRGRSLAAQERFEDALVDVKAAVAADPRDAVYVHTLSDIYESLRRYEDAAKTLEQYLDIVPKTEADETIRWARSQVKLLRSFRKRVPFQIVSQDRVFTVPFRIEDGRVIVKANINGGRAIDMTLDTGADQTVITPEIATRSSVVPIATLQSAGVGDTGVGFRDMQIARADQLQVGSLKIRNVTTLIKAPAMRGLPAREKESFSPLALGLSMTIDYGRRVLTMAHELPAGEYDTRMPLRVRRLAFVRVLINGTTPASFALDTGGAASAISRATAVELNVDPAVRRIPVRVYGSSGWDRRAFLMPYVDVQLAQGVGIEDQSLVVLNLDAPSALLGFNIGGVLGHEFLSRYVVAIDLGRHEVGLKAIQ